MSDVIQEGLLSGQLLRQRLAPAFERSGSQAAFAEHAGISKNTLNKYLSGTQPSPGALIRLADAAGVSIDYLVGRSAEAATSDTGPVFGSAVSVPFSGTEDFIFVPRLDVRASAGPGQAVVPADHDLEPQVAFRESWLRSLGVAPRNAEFVEARGDSMEPTICDGDLMLVDRGYGQVLDGKIYVLVVGGLVVVKRVSLLAVGGLMLISDNGRYPTQTIPRSEVNDLTIEARVAWYGRAI